MFVLEEYEPVIPELAKVEGISLGAFLEFIVTPVICETAFKISVYALGKEFTSLFACCKMLGTSASEAPTFLSMCLPVRNPPAKDFITSEAFESLYLPSLNPLAIFSF